MGVYVISLIARRLEKDRTTERSIIKTTERKKNQHRHNDQQTKRNTDHWTNISYWWHDHRCACL